MLSCAAEVIETIQSRRSDLIQLGVLTTQTTPELGALTQSDVEQIVAGYSAILIEALEGQSRETFEFYTETVIAGAVAKGDTVQAIMKSITTFNILVMSYLAQHLPPKLHTEIIPFLARLGAEFAVAVMQTALSASGIELPK